MDARTVRSLTTPQMVEVDRLMVEEYGIDLLQMMEHAGTNLARLAMSRFLGRAGGDESVVVLAGTGGNAGGALVCARHLHNHGVRVTVHLTRPPASYAGVPAHQLRILERLGLPIAVGPPDAEASGYSRPKLVVDGIIGYSLRGAPRGVAADLIRWTAGAPAPVLSLDVPSGLDSTSGAAHDPTIRAAATMTLALPKVGLATPGARAFVGELYLADIGVPPELYAATGIELTVESLFAENPVIPLT